ncbi:MAG: sugar phosphate isomerase/epimerase, partial [Calditrichales bacterium]
MKRYVFLVLSLIAFCGYSNGQARDKDLPVYSHPVLDEHEGWRLGIQLYSFHKNTFMEALDKAQSLGVSWVEAYPGQVYSSEKPDLRFDHNLAPELRTEVLKILNQKGLTLVNYGVVTLPNDEIESRKVFDFAKAMGIETIVSEPVEEAWDMIDLLCQEYQINVAIHNHPDPSRYWNPDKVLEVSKDRSKYIGACADIGHWMHSGVDPLEAIRKLKGRIISFHFGDLNEFDKREAHDVPWGTGAAGTDALLKELYAQDFEGVFSVEYEYNVEASLPDIEQSIGYFKKVVTELNTSQWKPLFTDNLSNATCKPGSWNITDGVL